MNWKEIYLSKEEECLSLLEALGFDVVAYKKCNKIDNIQKYYQSYIDSIRKTLDWDIDGLVVKTNDIKQDKWDIPDRGIAYKFPHETGVTKLLDVIWQDTGGRI